MIHLAEIVAYRADFSCDHAICWTKCPLGGIIRQIRRDLPRQFGRLLRVRPPRAAWLRVLQFEEE